MSCIAQLHRASKQIQMNYSTTVTPLPCLHYLIFHYFKHTTASTLTPTSTTLYHLHYSKHLHYIILHYFTHTLPHLHYIFYTTPYSPTTLPRYSPSTSTASTTSNTQLRQKLPQHPQQGGQIWGSFGRDWQQKGKICDFL